MIPCLTVPCAHGVDALLELETTPLVLLLLAVGAAWLLHGCCWVLVGCVRLRTFVACTLAVACCALAVGHHWRPPRCDLAHWRTSAISAAEPLSLAIFWHIGAFEHRQARLDEIISRQFGMLNRSKLLEHATVHLGIVGSARPPALRQVLRHPRVSVAASNRSGHECVTSQALWRWALSQSCPSSARWWPLSAGHTLTRYVLYIHSRGLRHNSSCHTSARPGQCAEDWTVAMEHFTIGRWRDAIEAMERSGALTAGLELFPHPARIARRRIGFGPVWHYRQRAPNPLGRPARTELRRAPHAFTPHERARTHTPLHRTDARARTDVFACTHTRRRTRTHAPCICSCTHAHTCTHGRQLCCRTLRESHRPLCSCAAATFGGRGRATSRGCPIR